MHIFFYILATLNIYSEMVDFEEFIYLWIIFFTLFCFFQCVSTQSSLGGIMFSFCFFIGHMLKKKKKEKKKEKKRVSVTISSSCISMEG